MQKYGEPALFFLMAFFWGLNYIMVKYAYSYDVSSSILIMRVLYALAFSSALFFRQIKFPKKLAEHLKVFVLANLNITAFFSLWFFGETGVSASLTSIIIYSYPIMSLAASYFLLNDRFGMGKATGIALGFAGLVIIFFRSVDVSDYLDLIMLILAALSWALGTVFYRKFLTGYDSAGLNTLQLLYAMPVVLVIALITGGINRNLMNPQFNLIMLYMGSLGTAVAYFIFLTLYRKYRVSAISAYFFIVPAISVVLSLIILHEGISRTMLIGFAIMSVGIYMSGRLR
ncbi:EamA/RhaT family transporter [Thermoplasma sp. Kam2015]|uniref:DMT family transporter n=1 Tax=Thermoplasma sp. Kam2015 TaxID=2094122 RepID=UPI000D90E504|nr:EamA family transporter [Thermoplasma sp. Kam2015]PYB68979.1 EamA/RhaT family transporter [Thermoplasma sp. Kam2015]